MTDLNNNDLEFNTLIISDDEEEFLKKYRKLSDDQKLKFTEYLFSMEISDSDED